MSQSPEFKKVSVPSAASALRHTHDGVPAIETGVQAVIIASAA
jgi:hypothetical protein